MGARRRKMYRRVKQCKSFLTHIKKNRFSCQFITSDWALAEMIQAIRDDEIMNGFRLDGNEISMYNRMKEHYRVPRARRDIIHSATNDFEKFLNKYNFQIAKYDIDANDIHECSLKYSLETADAMHVLIAKEQSCKYLVTVDSLLLDAKKVGGISIVNPDNLFTISELRAKSA